MPPDPYAAFSSPATADAYGQFSSPVQADTDTRPTAANVGMPAGSYQNGVRVGPNRSDYYDSFNLPRMIGQFAQGNNSLWAKTLGFPVDLVNSGAKAAGLQTSDEPVLGSNSWQNIFNYISTLPARYREGVQNANGGGGSPDSFGDSRDPRFQPQSRAEEIAGDLGRAFGGTTSTILPGGLVARTAQAGTLPAIVGEGLAARPVAQTAINTAGTLAGDVSGDPNVGAAVTAGLPIVAHGAQRAVSAAPPANTQEAERRALLEFGRQNDLGPQTAGKIIDSGKLQTYEGAINRLPIPFLGGRVKATEEAGRDAWQRAILERAGIQGETAATPQILENNRARLGQQFTNLAGNTTLNVTPRFGQDLAAIRQEYGDRLFEDIQPGLMRRIDELAQAPAALAGQGNPTATIAGRTYQNIRSDLSRISGTATRPADRRAAGAMVTALDDMAERSIPPDQMADWRQARQQWRNQLAIEDSVQGSNNAQTAVGNIPVARFGRESQDNPDLARLGQYGNKFVGEKMPYDTASRHGASSIGHLVTGGLGALGGTAGAHGHLPINAYTMGAGMVAATPFAADLAMNNPITRALLLARYRNATPAYVNPSLVGTSVLNAAKQLP